MKNEDNSKIIGFRLATMRIFYELTQAELAEKIGCSQRHISHVEKGKTNITAKFLYNIINQFNLPEHYFNPEKEGPETYIDKKERTKEKLCQV